MTPENRAIAIAEELDKSAEELAAARTLRDAGIIRPAVTRVYYAAFHAARALLFAEGLEPRTHSGVQHLLNLHFFRQGRLEARWNRVLARLQKFREKADYATVFVIERDGLDEELAEAESFVERARRLLSELGFPPTS